MADMVSLVGGGVEGMHTVGFLKTLRGYDSAYGAKLLARCGGCWVWSVLTPIAVGAPSVILLFCPGGRIMVVNRMVGPLVCLIQQGSLGILSICVACGLLSGLVRWCCNIPLSLIGTLSG